MNIVSYDLGRFRAISIPEAIQYYSNTFYLILSFKTEYVIKENGNLLQI